MSEYSIVVPVVLDGQTMPADVRCVPVCGEYNETLPTYGSGKATVIQTDERGRTRVTVTIASGTTIEAIAAYLEDELVHTANVPAGTNYYPASEGFAMTNYRHLCIMGVIAGGVTATIEASVEETPTSWLDITRAGYDLLTNTTGNISFVDTNFILDFEQLNVARFRVKSITADATNTVEYHIRRSS